VKTNSAGVANDHPREEWLPEGFCAFIPFSPTGKTLTLLRPVIDVSSDTLWNAQKWQV
jgi:hypothetical protein